jgi:PAS domain S-box-containing protein
MTAAVQRIMTDSFQRKITNGLWLLALLIAGVAGNHFNLSFFFGVDFLFGSIAAFLIIALYGPVLGVISALVISSYTYLLWSHPYAIAIFTAEALFVAYFYRRASSNLILLDGLYWLCLGMPLVWLFYGEVMGTEVTGTLLVMLKQSVNGMFNALIASVLLLCVPALQRQGQPAPLSLGHAFFILVTSLIFFPALTLTILDSRREFDRLENEVRQRLTRNSRAVAAQLLAWQERRLHAVYLLSSIAAEHGIDSGKVRESTPLLSQAVPSFRTLYVANEEGLTVAFHPIVNELGESTIGLSFADRDYFQKAKQTRKPVLSELFIGRGGVFEPIQVLTVPVLENGEFRGIVAGGLDIEYIRQALLAQAVSGEMELTLLDARGKVIASSIPERRPMSELDWPETGMRAGEVFLWEPEDDRSAPQMIQWQRSYYSLAEQFDDPLRWTLLTQISVAPFQVRLYQAYIHNLAVALFLSFAALLLAGYVSRRFWKPVNQLAAMTTGMTDRMAQGERTAWPRSAFVEVTSLIDNFRSMVGSLQQSFGAVQRRTAELELEVAERSRIEQALRSSETRFRMLFEQAPLAVQLFSPTGDCIQANCAWERLWNSSRTLLQGYNLFRDTQFAEKGIIPFFEKARDGEVVRVPPVLYDPQLAGYEGRPRWVEALFYPVKTEGGDLMEVVAILIDVTEQLRAEAELRDAQKRLQDYASLLEERVAERTARLHETISELEAFSYSVSHDLRAPLRAMQGFSHALIEDFGDTLPAQASDYLHRIRKASLRLDKLIQEILTYSRVARSELDVHPIELEPLIHEMIQQYPAFQPPAAHIHIRSPLDPVLAHDASLTQCLTNLLGNAVKFVAPEQTPEITIRTESHGDAVRILVEDNGIGIAREHQVRIFGIFEQIHSSKVYEGTGIGLAIVRKAVERMGGSVGVVSEPGKGSRFWIELPRGGQARSVM